MVPGPSSRRLRLQRLKIQTRDVLSLAVSENRIRVPLALFVAIFVLWVLLQRSATGDLPMAVIQTLLSIAEVMLGVYISFELIFDGLRPASRDRILRPDEVVEFYEARGCAGAFVRMTDLPGWDPESAAIDRVPAVVESIPDRPVPTTELTVTLRDRYYPLPDRVERLYEPVLDDLEGKFVDEGNFNQMKLRPMAFGEDGFEMGTTTFFNNFATNLCPDYDLYDHRTPRELLHPLVFHPDGRLRSLGETDLPYIAASAGMVVAENGEAIFPIRSRDVVIEGMNLGLSFGGSWDADVVEVEGPHGQVTRELAEERGVTADHDVDVHYLGTMRRLDLLGKPDCFVTAVVDGVPDWSADSREETESVVVRLVPEDVTVDDIGTLLEHAETVTERVCALLAESPYRASPGLLYWLYLLNQQADSARAGERAGRAGVGSRP